MLIASPTISTDAAVTISRQGTAGFAEVRSTGCTLIIIPIEGSTIQISAPCRVEDAAQKFLRLAEEWRVATAPLSSLTAITEHPAYLKIIGMGREALPLLLRELTEEDPDHWFTALTAITEENPVPPDHAGDIDAMRQDWLNWGRQRLLV